MRKKNTYTTLNVGSQGRFSVTEGFTQKITFSPVSVSRGEKNVAHRCALNFDATDLPHAM